ncbi:pantothenate kinase [Companilactobacillus sp. RD055328]|uniref:type I pantothenate kinase n=1 Tax=Companilactobacillus sp. RD055328 TaxID=2916634 RepID=UPI001FC83334|nr:type I pantothenate kinase [Companilactobacillus sp. RD055328]GKQ42415.1 pantothenate kinase [Companilactobacillus sp. RD055328]
MNEMINYDEFNRQEWQEFHGVKSPTAITDAELKQLKSLDDEISVEDVRVIYAPIRHLLHIFMHRFKDMQKSKAHFLNKPPHNSPFVIGISGSVAVGKSTTARLLKLMLTRAYPQYKVEQITTDGFLYSNADLEAKGILEKKGFPESYDMGKLLEFLSEVKENKAPVKYPKYSHQIYDVVKDEHNQINQPDILIIEGINTLQLPKSQRVYVSDFFDFSIYIDAETDDIKNWFMQRFETLLDSAFTDETSYYHKWALGSRKAALKMADETWEQVNYKNLVEYIEPTKNRADLILHKASDHLIDKIYLRKY